MDLTRGVTRSYYFIHLFVFFLLGSIVGCNEASISSETKRKESMSDLLGEKIFLIIHDRESTDIILENRKVISLTDHYYIMDSDKDYKINPEISSLSRFSGRKITYIDTTGEHLLILTDKGPIKMKNFNRSYVKFEVLDFNNYLANEVEKDKKEKKKEVVRSR